MKFLHSLPSLGCPSHFLRLWKVLEVDTKDSIGILETTLREERFGKKEDVEHTKVLVTWPLPLAGT